MGNAFCCAFLVVPGAGFAEGGAFGEALGSARFIRATALEWEEDWLRGVLFWRGVAVGYLCATL